MGKTLPSPDRVKRGEVYEKEWHFSTMDTIYLEEGTCGLNLSPISSGGRHQFELKGIQLKKLE